jgi:tetratricopeptide (TPR) repeat protein
MEPAPELAPSSLRRRSNIRLRGLNGLLLGAVRNLTPDLAVLRPSLLKEGLHRVSGWAHIVAALPPLAADFIKPAEPYCTLWVLAGALAFLILLLIAIRAQKIAADRGAAIVVFCLALALYSLGVIGLERLAGEDSKGALAHFSSVVEHIQRRLGLIERNIKDIKSDTAAIKQAQQTEAAQAEARHREALEGQQRLERLVVDAAGGGAAAVRAIAEIRGLLRPGNPEIDSISAELLPALVKRILADLRKPGANPEEFSGFVKQALAEAQAHAAALDFGDAARVLDAALARTEAGDRERARGRAVLLAERGRIASLQLRYRDAAGFYRRAAEALGFDAEAAWVPTIDAADAYRAQGDEFGDNAALADAIAAYKSALKVALNVVPRERALLYWAMTQSRLGSALSILGEREKGTAHLEEAVGAYRSALQEFTRERDPLLWAMTQNDLGNAHEALGEREKGTAQLEEAVTAYRSALQELTRQRVPLNWATTENNLGNALERLGEREKRTERLEEAVAAYHAALEERTRERVPLDWATTENNLGAALEELGAHENGAARLEEAVAAFRAALEERTRERLPLRWADTQTNLGNALAALGKRENGTVRLQEAVAAYRAALEERTRERVPLEWERTQKSLADALVALGEREEGTARLEEAVAAYRAALEARNRDSASLDWGLMQVSLVNALSVLGERDKGTARLEEAVVAYRAALEAITRERVPLAWAMTQVNLGNALEALGKGENGTARLEEAVAAYDAALAVFATAGADHHVDRARRNRDRAVMLLNQRRQ